MQDISIISMIFTVVLALSCLFFTVTPFFKWEAFIPFSPKGEDSARAKESLLSTLNELEFEYKMDKMSQSDYKNIKKQYESQVALLMKEEEEVTDQKMDSELMAEVEKEIEAQMKSHRNKKGEGK